MNGKPNTIAFWLLMSGVVLTVFLFAESRNDPSLRIATLVSATAFVSSLGSIASTLLTGKDVTAPGPGHGVGELPPGSVATRATSSTVEIPPIAK